MTALLILMTMTAHPVCRYVTGAGIVVRYEVCDKRYEHFPTIWRRR